MPDNLPFFFYYQIYSDVCHTWYLICTGLVFFPSLVVLLSCGLVANDRTAPIPLQLLFIFSIQYCIMYYVGYAERQSPEYLASDHLSMFLFGY